ncbi:hypothetical protein Cpir12675_003922 [Ceratocystis pirilliformis]|uniref:Gamma-glutamylcyclotransferase AIG2-like domain-containing protein n=1 Tax=Ceratocystis pirilliformis TaxID=259994 RepID=A0ABR3Z2W3_9PEZI
MSPFVVSKPTNGNPDSGQAKARAITAKANNNLPSTLYRPLANLTIGSRLAPPPQDPITLADVRRLWPTSPIPVFIYGSLRDPDVLQMASGISQPPELRPALIRGFESMMWTVFPSAIACEQKSAHAGGKSSDSVIYGSCFDASCHSFIAKLSAYEGPMYSLSLCTIELLQGTDSTDVLSQSTAKGRSDRDQKQSPHKSLVRGLIFVAAHNTPVNKGTFDLTRWQQISKQATLMRLVNELAASPPAHLTIPTANGNLNNSPSQRFPIQIAQI